MHETAEKLAVRPNVDDDRATPEPIRDRENLRAPSLREDGSIARGAQNMPGDWSSEHFHLPTELAKHLPLISKHHPLVMMHNDAVVQGLSELPFMQDVKHWAVLTIGTGLGNASYTNRVRPG